MNILTLDLATEFGWCGGVPQDDLARIRHGAISLRTFKALDCPVKDSMRLTVNLAAWLKAYLTFKESWPDLVIYEAPMDPQAKQQRGEARNSKSMLLPWHLAVKVEEMCYARGIRCEKVWPITVRNAFLGKDSAGDRAKTKRAVIERCIEWGYLRPGAKNDNEADAVAMWHWAQIRYGRWQPPFEMMFGQKLFLAGGTR